MELAEPCLVKIDAFEGPLDLLLHLIKKNEIDIYDIPIAVITEQYLEYLEMMRNLNLEIVGDYLVVAAELGLIKSHLLLPQPEPEKEDEGDPRAELVRRLVEYQRYKEAALKLSEFQILERDVFVRVFQDDQEGKINALIRADLWALIDALRDIYKRRNEIWPEPIRLELETSTIDEKIEELVSKVRSHKTILFEELFDELTSSYDFVLTFLALLELIRSSIIAAYQDSPYSSIKLVYLGGSQLGTQPYQEGN